MLARINLLLLTVLLIACSNEKKEDKQASYYTEPHRPQVHFSPEANWMNDPNGMVYFDNTYHLFYQYYPDSTVWGPMHWGHATSTDLVHWEHQPIALYPDSLGYIFSGSAIVDSNNTSGFGKDGKIPLVAIYTSHDPVAEKENRITVEKQSIAYSLDAGKTWTKYAGNPVLPNPGIRDFRDPKVSWFEAGKKWIMTLAAQDHITFYSSKDLKTWTHESDFGKDLGAHGGVWECPDLFKLNDKDSTVWILVVNLNPGGPNGGSATQYFTGNFDGHEFTTTQTGTKWLDYGPDEYAGITWSNTGDRKIFLGWMSNWQYANLVPTDKWRSATTIPRELGLAKLGADYLVSSQPVAELKNIAEQPVTLNGIKATNYDLTAATGALNGAATLKLTAAKLASFTLTLTNKAGEKVDIGYDKSNNQFFIDRTNSGKVDFEKGFAARHTAPRFSTDDKFDMTLVIDKASVELFADSGLTVMTEIFFPNRPFDKITINANDGFVIDQLVYTPLASIWRKHN